jgi:hypothetical protein
MKVVTLFKTSFFLLFLTTNVLAQGVNNEMINLIIKEADSKGISNIDESQLYIYNDYTSKGIRHAYAYQSINNIPIHNTYVAYHTNGSITHSQFDILESLNGLEKEDQPELSSIDALKRLSISKDYDWSDDYSIIKTQEGDRLEGTFNAPSLSNTPIPTKLWYHQQGNELKLAWEFEIDVINSDDYFQYIVDATSGEIVFEYNYTITCNHNHDHANHDHEVVETVMSNEKVASVMGTDSSYLVFDYPLESPHDGGRTEVLKPWLKNPAASPNGWHNIGNNDYQHSRGNNVDAYDDSNNSNGPSGGNAARADGGSGLDFDFPWTSGGSVSTYIDAATTNLFYWSNLCHDVWYNYGFDEGSGNFQEENYSGQGNASDYVRAEAQDGGGSCNANMSTPPDGGNARMQMYVCGNRDGSLDNVVVVHEYGHGISIRLTGGPGTSSCLNNAEQMGEGWSDYFGVVMTIKAGDLGTDPTGVGMWLFQQNAGGSGIRPYPYSTDMNINPFTYDALKTNISRPHGIGSVWATMLWDMTWNLIGVHGFDPDIYDGTGGNNVAMALVIEALKLQPCRPGFVDGRDAILLADSMLYGGANQEQIWKAFARRGLGYSADQGTGYNRYDGVEAFDMPPAFAPDVTLTVDTLEASPGFILTYTVKAINDTGADITGFNLECNFPDTTNFITASNGGSINGDKVVWPTFDLINDDSITYTYNVQVDLDKAFGVFSILDDIESGVVNWDLDDYGSTEWVLQSSTVNSPSNAFFADDASGLGHATIQINTKHGMTNSSELSFYHLYNTENDWDGGRVMYSENNGLSWIDAGPLFTQNGYNNTLYDDIPGFSGNSGGFIESKIDLSSFDTESLLFRFQMENDLSVGGNGWYIDDISITNIHHIVDNSGQISYGEHVMNFGLEKPTYIIDDPVPLVLTFEVIEVTCGGSNDGRLRTFLDNPGNPNPSYSYEWSNGATGQSIQDLSEGTYSVTVTDGLRTAEGSEFVPGPTKSVVIDPGDVYTGIPTLRYKMIDDYCPNDTILFHPDLLNDSIRLDSRIVPIGMNTIIGLGKDSLTIDAQGNDLIFKINSGIILNINDLTLTGGEHPTLGGAINNNGNLELNNVKFINNSEGGIPLSITNGDGSVITINGKTDIEE